MADPRAVLAHTDDESYSFGPGLDRRLSFSYWPTSQPSATKSDWVPTSLVNLVA